MKQLRKMPVYILTVMLGVFVLSGIGKGNVSKAETTSDGFEYRVEEGNVTITGYNGTATELTIPSEIEGMTVTSIQGYAFSYCSRLTSITIPSSVINIEAGAFEACNGLERITADEENKVYDSRDNCNAIIETDSNTLILGCKNTEIPSGVTAIGSSAFWGCSGLTSITVPSIVTSIDNQAFMGCSGLENITVDEGNEVYDSRDNCNAIIKTDDNTLILGCQNTVIPSSITSIGCVAFDSCIGLTSIKIPSSVTSIDVGAFQDCAGLTSITIPSSVTSIGEDVFCDCIGLTSITIPSSVTSIGDSLFYGCVGLTNISIPSSVTYIGDYAFCECSGLTSITIPKSVTDIGERAFYKCSGLTSITIPKSVTNIGKSAFFRCSELESIKVDKKNKVYDSRNNCNAIIKTKNNTLIVGCKNTKIPTGVECIGDGAFYECGGLKSINIPDSVIEIGAVAFYECSGLTSIIIPQNVTDIGDSAFCFCRELTSITIPSSVTYIGDCAFELLPQKAVLYVVPGSYADTYLRENGFSNIAYKIPKKGTKVVDSKTKSIYEVTVSGKVSDDKVTGAEVAFKKANKSAKSVTIPSTVKVDGITYKVTSVKDNAFKNNTKLTKVTVGKNVTKIGKNVFSGCKNLKTITIKSTKLKSIGKNALKGINKKAQISVPKKQKAAYTKLIKKNTGYKSSMKIK